MNQPTHWLYTVPDSDNRICDKFKSIRQTDICVTCGHWKNEHKDRNG